jgi:hypothetical protein
MVQHVLGASPAALGEPVEQRIERFAIERVVQEYDQIAGRKAITTRVAANQTDVRAVPLWEARFR